MIALIPIPPAIYTQHGLQVMEFSAGTLALAAAGVVLVICIAVFAALYR